MPSLSKVYERIVETQLKRFANNFLSPLLCGFRKGYNAQHALIRFVENLKGALDDLKNAAAVFMDLSKAFDCINHKLLIAKIGS